MEERRHAAHRITSGSGDRRVARAAGMLGCAAAMFLTLAGLPGATAIAAPPPTATKTFVFTGEEQVFDVPVGVTTLDVVAVGASGGGGVSIPGYSAGGTGGVRSGTVPVVPGQRLYVEVGGVGRTPVYGDVGAGGFNGGATAGWSNLAIAGGGGGGASDLRALQCGAAGSAESRLVVAAGGGGGGGGTAFKGGDGGDADAPGDSVPSGLGGAAGVGPPEIGGGGSDGGSGGGGGGGGGGLNGGGGGQGGEPAGGGGGGGSSGYAPPVSDRGAVGATPGEPPKVIINYLVPTADLSANAVTFTEPQPLGTLSPAQTVTIRNSGQVPLAVTSFAFTGADQGDFVLSSATACLTGVAPLATCTLSLRFAPSGVGARHAVLHLATSAGDRDIPLAGTGAPVDPPAAAAGPGPAAASTSDSELVIVAYQARVTARKVTMRYALTAPAAVALSVSRTRRSTVVARAAGRRGLNTIVWDRKLAGKAAGGSVYRLALTATRGERSASSTIAVRLRAAAGRRGRRAAGSAADVPPHSLG